MDEPKAYWVYITAGSIEEGRALGRKLVEERLAACVNLFPEMISIYEWEGNLQQDQEVALVAKTSVDRFEALKSKIVELHSYDCPCIIALPVMAGHGAYLNWIRGQVG
jgi:periplasmic divalent cation tolerance protein